MTRNEFMDSLHKALAGSLTSSTVNENMRYYEEYFDTQIRSGQSEEEIVAGLGEPRLLAKTIIQASKYQAQNFSSQEYDEVYEDGSQDNRGYAPKIYRMPGWLLLILVLAVGFAAVSIVSSVLSMFLPIIIPVVCIAVIVRLIRERN